MVQNGSNDLKMPQNGLCSMQGLSSTNYCLPLKVVFHRKSFSPEGRLPPKVVFLQRSSFSKGRLPTEWVFHRRLSSTKGCLPPTITPWFILCLWEQSTYQISASYLHYLMLDAWCMIHDVTPKLILYLWE